MEGSLASPADFLALGGDRLTAEECAGLARVAARYPARVSAHWRRLLDEPGGPLWRQCVPDPRELDDDGLAADPLAEGRHSPLPGLVHRYPDRVLVMASAACALYCRFCTRKRLVGQGPAPVADRGAVCRYLAGQPGVRDVLLSGGDPFMLSDDELVAWVHDLRRLPHLALVRIGTRVPSVRPERITAGLAARLAAYGPLYVNTHFNHPAELTPEAREACRLLAAAGIVLGNQTVLLGGVNDDPEVLRELFYGLLSMRVRPYYLHMMDLVRGTGHFRVPLERAGAIWERIAATTSGMALPKLMIDLPEGGGKLQYLPDPVRGRGPAGDGGRILFRYYDGSEVAWPDAGEEA